MLTSIQRTGPIAACLALVFLTCAGFAQDGVSTAGAARTKYLGNLGVIPKSREVVVEDFVNYHRHEIGRPKAGEAVALDVRWGNSRVSGDTAVLQVGLSTALAHDRQQLKPLNLALVIDKSGSMADADKLTKVKTALLTMVSQLRPTDVLSIVVFDSEAQVLLPAVRLTDPQRVKDLIRGIEPGSSTNINAGLMLGYQEDLKHFDKESTNRVILLTDGIANQGVTDPDRIAQASRSFNDRGIDLSTIGVGLDLNQDLLKELAKSGRGLFHFVADAEDVDKVFVKELQSLISPVATEPNLEIEYGPGLALEKVYGYEPKLGENSVKIMLDNMNSGMTEVVLLRFKLGAAKDDSKLRSLKVRLNYYDLNRKRTVETSQKTFVTQESGRADMLEDDSVAKNYSIALLAQSIRDMAAACEAHSYRTAENCLTASINSVTGRYPSLDDEDIRRTMSIAKKYQEALRTENRSRDPKDGNRDVPLERPKGANIVPNGDFSLGNTGFFTDREYIKPGTNCLWGAYYTVTPTFHSSSYQLHTNVPAEPFSAPRGGQVMYMNSGGASDQFTIWSAKVKCKAHTKYRVSFQEIGLTRGPEWRNSYEIRVNKDRSDAQLGYDGGYGEVSYEWDSGNSTSATVSIVRLPNAHGGGVIGICNIEMVPVR